MTQIKCPRCHKLFKTYAKYTAHFAKAHYKAKGGKKGKGKKVVVGKIPVWAK